MVAYGVNNNIQQRLIGVVVRPFFNPTSTSNSSYLYGTNNMSNWGVGDLAEFSYALNNTDIEQIKAAKTGAKKINESPHNSNVVQSQTQNVSHNQEQVKQTKANEVTAIKGQTEAQDGVTAAETTANDTQNTVQESIKTVETCEANKTQASENRKSCETALNNAESQVTQAQNAVDSAQANLQAAQSAQPYSAAAVATAQAALTTAEAALKTAEAEKALAEAQLEKAKAEEQIAINEYEKAFAQLNNDETRLELAEKQLEKANEALKTATENVATATTNLENKQKELTAANELYQQKRIEVQEQSGELVTKLDELLKKLLPEEDEKSSTKAEKKSSKWENITNASLQGLGTIGQMANMFTQKNTGTTETSTKRAMTPQESQMLNALLQDVYNYCNGINNWNPSNPYMTTTTTVNNSQTTTNATNNTTSTKPTGNPFVLRKKS